MDQCSHRHDIPSALQATSPNRPGHDLALGITLHPSRLQCSPASGSIISVARTKTHTRQRHADRLPLVAFVDGPGLVVGDRHRRRLLIHRAAVNAQDGLPTAWESSTAKCFSNQMVREVASDGMQLMGGYGYSKEYPMEQRLRDAYAWGIAGGTTDVQKTNIAAALVGRRFDQRR